MADILCYRCFHRFGEHQAKFKCVRHREEGSGAGSPLRFDAPRLHRMFGSRIQAPCPVDRMLTGFRVCPKCDHGLPYHAGRSPQRIVAIVGLRNAGKTIYTWSLLYRIREQLARHPFPYATVMFEDDLSFQFYQTLTATLMRPPRDMPATSQREVVPVITRVLNGDVRTPRTSNLVFFDHAGESLNKKDDLERYLRHLDHAAGLIYLVDPFGDPTLSADGLSFIVDQLPGGPQGRLNKAVAVVLTKADALAHPQNGQSELLPRDAGSDLWAGDGARGAEEVARTSGFCREVLRRRGHHHLLAHAENRFARFAFFAVSSLGHAPVGGRLTRDPQPAGVEHPLYWLLRQID